MNGLNEMADVEALKTSGWVELQIGKTTRKDGMQGALGGPLLI